MLLPDWPSHVVLKLTGMERPQSRRRSACLRGAALVAAIVISGLAWASLAQGAGGKVLLTRKYRLGESMVYVTKVRTNSKVNSNPPNLKDFFPPMPTDLRLNQQSTVTVSKVSPDGAADVQHRFDKFEIQTELATLPEAIRDSVTQAQMEVSQRMVGQTLTAHYDHEGHLSNFEGADNFFRDIDAPVKEPLVQMLRLFLEQMGGQSLYPDHPVKVGDEWTQKLDAPPSGDYLFQETGNSTLHYSGKTRYQGIKAAIVDYHFENALTPALEGLRKQGVLPQLEAQGAKLDIQISGKGEGRILVALDDGRVLQNHYTLHQTLSALMKSAAGIAAPADVVPRLEIQSDTEMEVDGSKP